jgi:hypothetical protein
MQKININNSIGLQAELTPKLNKAVAALKKEWPQSYNFPPDCLRLNPLQAEQHPTTSLGLTVVQSAEVPMGHVQLVTITPF